MRAIEPSYRPAPRHRQPRPAPHATVGPLAPKPTGVFAQTKPTPVSVRRPADARARQASQRAVVRNVAVAPAPKLAYPTQQQRTAAANLAVRSLAGQGIHTRAQVAALPARERQRANRLLGYTRTLNKYRQAAYALRQQMIAAQTPRSSDDKLQAALDEFRAERVAPPTSPTVRQLATQGSEYADLRNPRAVAGRAHRRFAGVDLTALGRSIAGATSLGAPTAENAVARGFLREAGRAALLPVTTATLAGRAAVHGADLARGLAQGFATGHGSPRTGLAASSLSADLSKAIAASPVLGSINATKVGHGALGDLMQLGAFPIIAGMELEQGATEAAKGAPLVGGLLRSVDNAPVVGPLIGPGSGTGRLTGLAKGTAQQIAHDPLVLLAQGRSREAGQSFEQHPGFALMDLLAAVSVAGRLGGAFARGAGSTVDAAGVRGALARAGSRVRPPIAHFDEPGAPVTERTFSGDLTRKAAQVLADRTRRPVRDAQGNVVTYTDRGREVPKLQPRNRAEAAHLSRIRANFESSRANARERMAREQASHDTASAVHGGRLKGRIGKRGQQVVDLVVRGVIRPDSFMADVAKRRAQIEAKLAEHDAAPKGKSPYHNMDEVKAAREQVAALRAFEKSPRAQAQIPQIVAHAQETGRRFNTAEAEANRLRVLEPEARRAALMDYAMSHMDARHFTVEEHARLEQAALGHEQRLRAEVDSLPKGPARAAKLAEWRAARDRRIAVSGRHPDLVRQHEALRGQVLRAKAAHRRAQELLRQAKEQRQRVLGRNEVRGGAQSMERMAAAQARPGSRAQAVLHFIDRALADEGALKKGAAAETRMEKLRKAADAKVERAVQRERAARKARVDAETAAAASRLPDRQAAMRNPDGTFLSDDAIEAHMRAHGVDPANVAFVTHRELGGEAFHTRFDQTRPNLGAGERRTGHAFERGSEGHGPAQLVAEAARKVTRNVKAEQLDKLVHDSGLRHPAMSKLTRAQRDHIDGLSGFRARLEAARATGRLSEHEARVVASGGYFTPREGLETAKRVAADTNGRTQLIPMRAFGGGLSADAQSIVRDLQRPGVAETFPGQLINDRIVTAGDLSRKGRRAARNVVLVSMDELNQLQKHLTPAGDLEKMAQALNVPFRFSVLAQPRWLTGNFVEPFLIRLPVIGSGLINLPGMANDIRIATKGVERMERSGNPEVRAAAAEIRAQQFGGLFIGGRGASVRRAASRQSDNAFVRGMAMVRDLPVVKQMAWLYNALPRTYFRINRQAIEQWAQRAGFGHDVRRDIQEITGSWIRAHAALGPALDDAMKGLVRTATQERFMREQHIVLGKYDGFGPRTRKLIQTIAPFLPWALAAARFVWWTMPTRHTALTAILTRTGQAYNDQWKAMHEPVAGLKGNLQYAIPSKDGGWVDVARYTPYGFSTPILGGDLQGATDQFFPQLTGAVAALEGKDPFGRDLQVPRDAKHPKGEPTPMEKVAIALYSLAESTGGPLPSLVRRLREHGETPYAGSTFWSPKTKPGTSHGMSALQRTLDPFRPTYVASSAAVGRAGPAGGVTGFLQRSGAGAVSAGQVSSDQEFVLRALSGR